MIDCNSIGPSNSVAIEQYHNVLAIQIASDNRRISGAPIRDEQITVDRIKSYTAGLLNIWLRQDYSPHSTFMVHIDVD